MQTNAVFDAPTMHKAFFLFRYNERHDKTQHVSQNFRNNLEFEVCHDHMSKESALSHLSKRIKVLSL